MAVPPPPFFFSLSLPLFLFGPGCIWRALSFGYLVRRRWSLPCYPLSRSHPEELQNWRGDCGQCSASLERKFFFVLFLFLFCSLEMRRGMQTGCLDFHKLPLLFFLDDRLSSSVSAYLIRCDRRNLSDTPRSTPKEEKKKSQATKPEDRSRALAGISI